ncbi:PepSY domain-containing protein [Actinoplanes sp. NPDC049118]|uniref:PepSY domain-containing protein n=1 Tax=Actinoplanes sp. NPDC049118 TaxID=3155769 RepID=UPI0033F7FB37
MNTAKLRSKRVIVTTSVIAVLAAGGGVWATAANADARGEDHDRVAAAAMRAVGGGTVIDIDAGDEPGEPAWEVEIRKPDGTEVEVVLDADLKVIGQHVDTPDTPDGDDLVLTADQRSSAGQAALAAVGGGTVTDIDAGDDPGVAYEVEVRDAAGTEWDVKLDTAFKSLTTTVS